MRSALQIARKAAEGKALPGEDVVRLAEGLMFLAARLAHPVQCHLDWGADEPDLGLYDLRTPIPDLPHGGILVREEEGWKIRFCTGEDVLAARDGTIAEAEEDMLRYIGVDHRSFVLHPFMPDLEEAGVLSAEEWATLVRPGSSGTTRA